MFGEVAEIYDRVRPTYPAALVHDVMAFGSLSAGDRAVEVGPGTGKATTLFAARGLAITGVEPSAEMATVARERLAGHPDVTIEQGLFEEYDGQGRFDLVFGGQAWHWVPLDRRYLRAHGALRAGGTLAYFFNRPDWTGNEEVRVRLDAVYDRLAPELPSRGPGSAWTNVSALEEETVNEIGDARHIDPLRDSPLFGDVEVRHYHHSHRYETFDYLDLVSTQSDHRLLGPDHLERLLAGIAEALDASGGAVTLGYDAVLYLARSAGEIRWRAAGRAG